MPSIDPKSLQVHDLCLLQFSELKHTTFLQPGAQIRRGMQSANHCNQAPLQTPRRLHHVEPFAQMLTEEGLAALKQNTLMRVANNCQHRMFRVFLRFEWKTHR